MLVISRRGHRRHRHLSVYTGQRMTLSGGLPAVQIWQITDCTQLTFLRAIVEQFCRYLISLIRPRTRCRLLTGIDRMADLSSSFWASFEVLTISSSFRITELSLSSSFWASFAPNDFFEPKRETRRGDPCATENRGLGRCICKEALDHRLVLPRLP